VHEEHIELDERFLERIELLVVCRKRSISRRSEIPGLHHRAVQTALRYGFVQSSNPQLEVEQHLRRSKRGRTRKSIILPLFRLLMIDSSELELMMGLLSPLPGRAPASLVVFSKCGGTMLLRPLPLFWSR